MFISCVSPFLCCHTLLIVNGFYVKTTQVVTWGSGNDAEYDASGSSQKVIDCILSLPSSFSFLESDTSVTRAQLQSRSRESGSGSGSSRQDLRGDNTNRFNFSDSDATVYYPHLSFCSIHTTTSTSVIALHWTGARKIQSHRECA